MRKKSSTRLGRVKRNLRCVIDVTAAAREEAGCETLLIAVLPPRQRFAQLYHSVVPHRATLLGNVSIIGFREGGPTRVSSSQIRSCCLAKYSHRVQICTWLHATTGKSSVAEYGVTLAIKLLDSCKAEDYTIWEASFQVRFMAPTRSGIIHPRPSITTRRPEPGPTKYPGFSASLGLIKAAQVDEDSVIPDPESFCLEPDD